MKNKIIIIILALTCGILSWTVYQQISKNSLLEEEISACKEAAEASSAETFILQQKAEEHRAEAEEHRQAAEEHKKIAEEALEKVEKLKR